MRAWRQICAAGICAGVLAFTARADDTPPAAATPDAAAIDVGRSIVVINDVDGRAGDAPAKHIQVDDDIVFQEDITTGSAAKAVLEFRDGSTFEIGPDAAVRIDSFVFNPEESTSHKALHVTRGVFRYVSAYIASDQDTKIATPAGIMGIRGSVAAGIVDPAVPDFLYLGEGSATFTNDAGSSTLQPGNSIAVPSAATPPMAPAAMPAPVAAQALQAIATRLPPQAALANRPAANDARLKRSGEADLVPAAQQQRIAAAAAGTSRPPPSVAGSAGLAGELGLLVEANRVNLLTGRQAARTPEQTAFLARATRENPNATVTLRRFTEQARVMHSANVSAGTAYVIRGVGHAAPSAAVMQRVTTAATRANPGAAALITRHAAESYRGQDRRESGRPAAERPAGERLEPRQPGNSERRQPGSERRQGGPDGRPAAERPAGQRPESRQRGNADRRQPGSERRQGGPDGRPAAERPAGQRPEPRQPGNSERRQPGFERRQGGPDGRPAAGRPAEQRPEQRQPGNSERRQPGFERRQGGPNVGAPAERRPERVVPRQQQPERPQPGKPPAKKRGDERDQRGDRQP